MYDKAPLDESSQLEILTRYAPQRPAAGKATGGDGALPNVVLARNRLVQYLPPSGAAGAGSRRGRALSALAGDRATSFFDYDWRMERVLDDGKAPGGGGLVELRGRVLQT